MHNITSVLFAGMALASIASAADAAPKPVETGFLFKKLTLDKKDYPYVVYVPENYDATKAWPLIMFLHGAGECGSDGWRPVMQGIGTAIMLDVAKWPFIVIIPQKPDVKYAWEQYDGALMQMLKTARKDYKVDGSRLYLTGLSQGGHGTWAIGARHADLWAAIAPICGYGGSKWPQTETPKGLLPAFNGPDSEFGTALKDTPVWAFHGEADSVVPIKETQDLVAAVKAAGGAPKITTYPGVDHNSWDRAYRTEDLGAWFLSHRKGG
ncbi:MAG TPA: prolyl oligopeptidase family serine peptidase [Armatimonadota bacterium]|jgi:predicted peptidase